MKRIPYERKYEGTGAKEQIQHAFSQLNDDLKDIAILLEEKSAKTFYSGRNVGICDEHPEAHARYLLGDYNPLVEVSIDAVFPIATLGTLRLHVKSFSPLNQKMEKLEKLIDKYELVKSETEDDDVPDGL